ncbi:MAG: UDP-glucose 4-epimerase GalE [Helicobacteraceae bacterium]|jgi:UDP-glucose 4-epimerase|nr:UDP-glucose 4-epimerase GalE [Helicobacteraceae bacterium]
MKTILVTGGAGYIGSHTVKRLSALGYAPVVADNLVYGHKEALPQNTPLEIVDLADRGGLKALFAKYKFDAVIHFAAYAYVGESVANPAKYYRNNVIGTLNLLDAMLEAGVKKIVFSSTCATYGEPQYTPIDEAHPQNPINAYGAGKLMIERVFADYKRAYDLRYIALRYFNAAGATADATIGESHNPETHLIPLVLRAAQSDKPVQIFGDDYDTADGTCVRDYIHVDDLADAHILALKVIDRYNGALNLGMGVGVSVREIINAAQAVVGKKVLFEIAKRRAGDPAKLVAANAKAIDILGWNPRYSDIETIIASAWNWEKSRRF